MIDWVNIVLRTLMCLAFMVLVLRPVMLSLVRREPDHEALEELANSAVGNAFKAWSQNNQAPAYYQNPELALLVLEKPELLNVPVSESPAETASATADTQASDAGSTPASAAIDGTSTAGTGAVEGVQTDGVPGQGDPAALAVADAPGQEDEVDPDAQLQEMRERIKSEQKKAKPSIPAELLNNANSYEDKLMVVRMIVDQERDRVAATLKRMIQVG